MIAKHMVSTYLRKKSVVEVALGLGTMEPISMGNRNFKSERIKNL